jgi:hypothetical protein
MACFQALELQYGEAPEAVFAQARARPAALELRYRFTAYLAVRPVYLTIEKGY